MQKVKILFFALVSVFAICSAPLMAEDDQIIAAVDVIGNVGVSSEVILSQLQTKVGQSFQREIINDDLKRLYSLGYFSDVSVETDVQPEGVAVTFVVEEKLALGTIEILGQHVVKKSVILRELDLKEGQVYNKKVLQDAVDKIKALYVKKGYYHVRIDPQLSTDPMSRKINLLLVIEEEQRVFVRSIVFEGNEHIPAKVLKKKMKIREKWILGGGILKEEQLEEDVEKLTLYYKSQGYMNVVVQKPVLTYQDDGKSMTISISIQEGRVYHVGIVEIKGNQLFPAEEIEKTLEMKEGAVFSQLGLLQDQRHIQDYYGDKGYIFANIKPSTFINDEAGLVDVSYGIQENELAYVERIIIQGNITTKDKVIRRELKIHPLEPFDGQKLKRSRERLYNLNYFEDVSFETAPGSEPNMKDLVVGVKEKKTGEFSFGGGYSSLDKLVGFVEIAQNNFDIFNFPSFVGAGQRMHVRAEAGSVRTNYSLGFTEPWLFDYPLLFGFDLFKKEWERSGYDEDRQGGDIRLGHALGEYNYLLATLTHEEVDIRIRDESRVPSQILRERGTKNLNSLSLRLTRDTRNNTEFATSGAVHSVTAEPMGGWLGGDLDVVRYTASTDWFFETWRKWVLETKARIGTIDRYGDTDYVPFYERFYAGGATTIRGYKDRIIGPSEAFEPVGGNSMLIFNAEYTFPIVEMLRGAVFADAGNVWEGGNDWDLGELKKGVGFGVRIKTPLGPIKLDYGFALDEDEGESKSRLHFSMGGFF